MRCNRPYHELAHRTVVAVRLSQEEVPHGNTPSPATSANAARRCGTEMMSVDDAEEPIDPALREWLGRLWPPHDFGPWPEGFTVGRDQIYDEDGR